MKEKEGEPQEKSPTGADRSGARASSLRRGENLDAARRPTESARLSEGSFPAEAPISGRLLGVLHLGRPFRQFPSRSLTTQAAGATKATLWMKTQNEGSLTPPCIVWKNLQIGRAHV